MPSSRSNSAKSLKAQEVKITRDSLLRSKSNELDGEHSPYTPSHDLTHGGGHGEDRRFSTVALSYGNAALPPPPPVPPPPMDAWREDERL